MTRSLKLLLAAACAISLLAVAPVVPTQAAQLSMCSPTASGTSPGPRRFTAPGSGTVYSLDNRGCTRSSIADLPDFQAAGFVPQTNLRSTAATFLAAGTMILPAGVYIDRIVLQETSGATVTGGVKIGTTAGGTEVVAGMGCTSTCLAWIPDASISTRIFANTAPTTLFIGSVGTFPVGPSLNVTVVFGFY